MCLLVILLVLHTAKVIRRTLKLFLIFWDWLILNIIIFLSRRFILSDKTAIFTWIRFSYFFCRCRLIITSFFHSFYILFLFSGDLESVDIFFDTGFNLRSHFNLILRNISFWFWMTSRIIPWIIGDAEVWAERAFFEILFVFYL